MSPRFANSPSNASAGGHDEQPCEVNNSTTIGRGSANAGDASPHPSRTTATASPYRDPTINDALPAVWCAASDLEAARRNHSGRADHACARPLSAEVDAVDQADRTRKRIATS